MNTENIPASFLEEIREQLDSRSYIPTADLHKILFAEAIELQKSLSIDFIKSNPVYGVFALYGRLEFNFEKAHFFKGDLTPSPELLERARREKIVRLQEDSISFWRSICEADESLASMIIIGSYFVAKNQTK